MTSRVGVAVVQFLSEAYRPESNRARSVEAIGRAAADGANLIVLPELAISGYSVDARGLADAAEPIKGGRTLTAWTEAARTHGVFIAGGLCERDGDRLFNSAMLVGPDGLVGVYRKLHLFDREKHVFAPGDRGLPVYDLPFGRVGLCVCYDLRFVEVLRVLALQGADLVAVPTAWVGGFDANVFDAMGFIGQARGAVVQANLNQVFLACASQSGSRPDIRFLGSSLIADPYGNLLGGPLEPDEEGILQVEIELATAAAARVRSELIRPREDRRTDVYGLTLENRRL